MREKYQQYFLIVFRLPQVNTITTLAFPLSRTLVDLLLELTMEFILFDMLLQELWSQLIMI